MFYELHVRALNACDDDGNNLFAKAFDNEFEREAEAVFLEEMLDERGIYYDMVYIDQDWKVNGVQYAWCPDCLEFYECQD